MDRQTIAVMIPLTVVFFGGLIMLSATALGKAIARRIAGGGPSQDLERRLGALESEVDVLRGELDSARAELGEAHERLDFAERTLARVKDLPRLPGQDAEVRS